MALQYVLDCDVGGYDILCKHLPKFTFRDKSRHVLDGELSRRKHKSGPEYKAARVCDRCTKMWAHIGRTYSRMYKKHVYGQRCGKRVIVGA